MDTNLSPIALFVYNRLWHAKETVESLKKNDLAAKSELFIFSDGPKSPDDEKKVREVREYIKKIDGFKSVTIFEKEKNLGLADSIINGVSEIVNKYGKIIVLEDDMISSPFFLRYMNEALDIYENEEKVIGIHGWVYPVEKKLPETFFLKGADCWGWATWKRGWSLFEVDAKKLQSEIIRRNLKSKFDFDNSYDYFGMLENYIKGKNNSWAIRWYASAFLNDKLSLYPGKTLIQNIGLKNGTHCQDSSDYDNKNFTSKPIIINKIPIDINYKAFKIIKKFIKSLKPNLIDRLKNRIKKYV